MLRKTVALLFLLLAALQCGQSYGQIRTSTPESEVSVTVVEEEDPPRAQFHTTWPPHYEKRLGVDVLTNSNSTFVFGSIVTGPRFGSTDPLEFYCEWYARKVVNYQVTKDDVLMLSCLHGLGCAFVYEPNEVDISECPHSEAEREEYMAKAEALRAQIDEVCPLLSGRNARSGARGRCEYDHIYVKPEQFGGTSPKFDCTQNKRGMPYIPCEGEKVDCIPKNTGTLFSPCEGQRKKAKPAKPQPKQQAKPPKAPAQAEPKQAEVPTTYSCSGHVSNGAAELRCFHTGGRGTLNCQASWPLSVNGQLVFWTPAFVLRPGFGGAIGSTPATSSNGNANVSCS